MLAPKKVKWRKMQKGRRKGSAWRGSTLAFGDYGLQAIDRGRLTARDDLDALLVEGDLEAVHLVIARADALGELGVVRDERVHGVPHLLLDEAPHLHEATPDRLELGVVLLRYVAAHVSLLTRPRAPRSIRRARAARTL